MYNATIKTELDVYPLIEYNAEYNTSSLYELWQSKKLKIMEDFIKISTKKALDFFFGMEPYTEFIVRNFTVVDLLHTEDKKS